MMQRAIQIANLLLATLAVYGAVNLFYTFIGIRLHRFDPTPLSGSQPAAAAPARAGGRPAMDYNVIVRRNLFHTKTRIADKIVPEADLATLKQTELNLKLWGTVSFQDRRSGLARAVIEERESRKQALYRVGDTIAQARVSEILRNSVVLDIGGRKEKLTMEEKIPRPGTRVASASADLSAGGGASGRAPEQKISLKRSRVDNAMENLNALMNQVKIRPYFKDGEAAGFIVANIAPESVVRQMGLKTGDIVTSVNGRQIKTADDAMAFYSSLKAGDNVSVQLMRRGRPRIIEYAVEEEMLGKN